MRKSIIAFMLILTMLVSMLTTVSAEPETPDTDLAAHWKFDEGSGTTAADSSGNGLIGTLMTKDIDLPAWSPGKANGGMFFDGSTNYVDIGSDLRNKLAGAPGVTISVWVNNQSVPASSASQAMFFSSKIDKGSSGLELSFTTGGVKLGARSQPTDSFLSLTAPFSFSSMNNSWHHIVGIADYTNDKMKIYIDGELQIELSKTFLATNYTAGTNITLSDKIGCDAGDKLYYNGQIDDLQIYKRTLSETEINDLFVEGTNAIPGIPPPGADIDHTPVDIIPVINQDIIGEVYGFDGVDDYINLGSSLRNDLNGSSAVTVAAWVYNEDLPEANKKEIIFSNKINGADSGVEMYLSEHRLKVGGRSIATDFYQSKEVAFDNTKSWHYVVGVLDYANDEIRIYIDGDLKNKTDKAVNFGSTTYTEGTYVSGMDYIGRDYTMVNYKYKGSSYFKGSISNLGVYNRALSDEEIRNIAGPVNPNRIRPLAEDFTTLYRTENGQTIHTYNPGIVRLPNGRLIASFTINTGTSNTGRLTISDDGGVTWSLHELVIPFIQARFFVAGDALYALGRMNNLMIMKSTDWGNTWGPAVNLTNGENWESSVNTIVYNNGYVYTAIEKRIYNDTVSGTLVNALAPVLLRANVNDDLTDPSKWTFSSELAFRDAVSKDDLDYFGIPYYDYYENPYNKKIVEGSTRQMHAMGWLETNVVQIKDPTNYLYDPDGKTYYLISRSNSGSTGYANIVKVVENDDGTMTTSLVTTPSDRKMLFIPFPGGQMKFYTIYDDVSNLYWLVSSQATDSMIKASELASDRYDNTNGQRERLQLSYSKNGMDWVFAGIVAIGPTSSQARHYASMAIDGDDLLIVSRSGDGEAPDAHNGNIITMHNVKDFRSLVYSTNSAFVEDVAISDPSDEEPIDEEPIDEEPIDEEPIDEEPIDEEPIDEEPIDEEPIDEEPIDEEPIDEEPIDEEPIDEEPIDEEPIDKKPVDEDTSETTAGSALTPVLDKTSGDVKTSIDANTLEKLFALKTENVDGVKMIKLEIPKVDGALSYTTVLPASVLTSADGIKQIELETEFATIQIPDNMLANTNASSAKEVGISILKADTSKIPSDVKEKIGNRPLIDLNLTVDGNNVSFNNPEAPVKIAIPYTPAEDELKDPEHIVVWSIDEAGNVVPVPNGRYNAATESVVFTTTHFGNYAVAYVFKSFEDTIDVKWAKREIEVMASKGVINGTSDKTFEPSDSITRADFTVLLVRALGLDAVIDSNFEDISKNDYYYEGVAIAKKLGLVNGQGDNTFSPNEKISRQDMMIITARALKLVKKLDSTGTNAELTTFTDGSKVASYAANDIRALVSEGLVKGDANQIYPLENTTRAEAAVLMYRIYNK